MRMRLLVVALAVAACSGSTTAPKTQTIAGFYAMTGYGALSLPRPDTATGVQSGTLALVSDGTFTMVYAQGTNGVSTTTTEKGAWHVGTDSLTLIEESDGASWKCGVPSTDGVIGCAWGAGARYRRQ